MPLATVQAYLDQLPGMQADLRLALAEVVSLPYMNERTSRSVVERWEREAVGETLETQQRRMTPTSPVLLQQAGMRVVLVPPLPKNEISRRKATRNDKRMTMSKRIVTSGR